MSRSGGAPGTGVPGFNSPAAVIPVGPAGCGAAVVGVKLHRWIR